MDRRRFERTGAHHKQSLLLCAIFFGLGSASAAAEQLQAPNIVIDGSIPLQYTTNVRRSAQDRVSDYYTSPYFKVSAAGELQDDFRYSLYASTGVDKYFRFTDSDFTAATAGFFGLRDAQGLAAFVKRRLPLHDLGKKIDGVMVAGIRVWCLGDRVVESK